jgi:ribosome-associated heat shock protein Hsp15
MRLDKWLWVARFYKTRALATEEVARGLVLVNGLLAKPARDIKPGDTLAIRYVAFNVSLTRTLTVVGLALTRGSATVAQTLYSETAESIQAREKASAERHLHSEPAHSITGGRPSKRDRRELGSLQNGGSRDWDDRWSAALE